MRIPKLKDFLCEMAFERRKILDRCSGLVDPIVLHLIKLLYFKDPINYQKHLSDIDGWLQQIQSMDYKKSNKKLKFEDYYNCLYLEPFTSPTNTQYIEKVIKRRLKRYRNLPTLELSILEIGIIIEMIMMKTAELISTDSLDDFETDVWNKAVSNQLRNKMKGEE